MTKQQHNNGLDTKGLTALFPTSDIQWRAGATNDKDNPTEALALAYIDARAVQERSIRCVARKAGKTNIARPKAAFSAGCLFAAARIGSPRRMGPT